MNTEKDLSISMLFFIVFIVGVSAGMALPDGIVPAVVGIVIAFISLFLILKSVVEHIQANDDRIHMMEMEEYTQKIYGNRGAKQKHENQDETEAKLEEVSAGKKAQMLAKIKRKREKGLEFEINN